MPFQAYRLFNSVPTSSTAPAAGQAGTSRACCPPNPYFPYFHLKGEGLWHLQPLPGREAVVGAMISARSAAAITANIACAFLDADLHALVQDEPSRNALRETLLVA